MTQHSVPTPPTSAGLIQDRITQLLKKRSVRSSHPLGPNFEDAFSAFTQARSGGPARVAPSFGEAMNKIKADQLAEIETLGTLQNQQRTLDIRTAEIKRATAAQQALQAHRTATLAETKRYHRAIEGRAGEGKVYDKKVAGLMETLPREIAIGILTGRFQHSRDPISQQLTVIDVGTGRVVFNPSAIKPAPTATPPPTAMPAVDYPQATGASGFFGRIINVIADLAGGKSLPAPQAEKAGQALTNLQVRTQTAMQAVIPGRPSNYLMGLLERLSVTPNSLLQGDMRSAERFRQTAAMLREEVGRIDHDILGNPGSFTPAQIAASRANVSELRSLLSGYDKVVAAYGEAALPIVKSKAEWDALPGGTRYRHVVGGISTIRTKQAKP